MKIFIFLCHLEKIHRVENCRFFLLYFLLDFACLPFDLLFFVSSFPFLSREKLNDTGYIVQGILKSINKSFCW